MAEVESWTGSCTCGAIGFEIRGPASISYCHCLKCRKETGTNGSTLVVVPGTQFAWLEEENTITPEARCGGCGSLVPDHNPVRDLYIVPAGSLDSDDGLRVSQHIFVGSKAGWDVIGDDAPQYDEDGPPLTFG